MLGNGSAMRALVDALEEPSLIVEGLTVSFANEAARSLLGSGIEGRDVRFAIRHPQALEQILGGRGGDVDATGIAEHGRPWRVIVRELGHGAVLVRLVDRSAAAAAEKIRVDFVANASHELRTPLSTLLGYAETLADDGELDPALRARFTAVIRDEARRMLRIIEDLMSLSRIEADRFRAPPEVVSIAELIETAAENSKLIAGPRQCEVAVEVAPALSPVRGDQAQLLQVLDNLLTNAVRYGCASGPCRVRIHAEQDRDWVRITVTDNGPGIAREHLPRLTERFYRVDAARSRDSGGTGLGLSIVKHIVERHRGTLEIKSTVGEGTSVTVQLPATD
jgi:two-component system, OmpR family, phosphate regulon sensor histidine kinase PhoR